MNIIVKFAISFAVLGAVALLAAAGIYIATAVGAAIKDPWGGIIPLGQIFICSEGLAVLFAGCEWYRRGKNGKNK